MTREETVKIIRIMVDSYPNYKPNNISETVDVWNMMLSEYTYEQISVALKAYILSDTSGFAPSIGQLVSKLQYISNPQELNEMEAWSVVSNAIGKSCYNYNAEYEKLPETVKRAVGSAKQLKIWATDENFNEQVVSSNFMRCYRTEIRRKEEFKKLPKDIKEIVEKMNTRKIISSKEALCDVIPMNLECDSDKNKCQNAEDDSVCGYTKDIEEKIKNMADMWS